MRKFLPYTIGIALGLAPLAAFATSYTMPPLSSSGTTMVADVLAAGGSGSQFSLAMLASILGTVLVLGFVGYVLATFTRLVSAGLHVGRR